MRRAHQGDIDGAGCRARGGRSVVEKGVKAMMKGKLSVRHSVTLLLPVAASLAGWPAGARAASKPVQAAGKQAPAAPQESSPPSAGLPFPGQLSSLFRIDDADPEASVP